MWPNPNSRFKMSGGRAGVIEFSNDSGRTGQLEWEMLLGEQDIGIHADYSTWLESGEQMTPDEVQAIVQELATDSGMTIQLTFPDGDSVVRPNPPS